MNRRNSSQLYLNLGHELIIDNFAGGGGASTGIEQAIGRPIDIAINHDGEALALHAANHPFTKHFQEDVFDVHPAIITRNQPIGLAWFSPDCKHHSKAKGGKPVDKNIRGLAWVTLQWGVWNAPRCIMLENVEEFSGWGPLDENNKPDKAHKGRTFNAFIDCLSTGIDPNHPDLPEIFERLGADFPITRLYEGLGYTVEWKVIRACDYGTPTIRKRLYLIARRDGQPITWPNPTHGDPKSEEVKSGKLKPWRSAAECIDWSLTCPSIFDRKKPLAEATLRRLGKGIKKFVLEAEKPFIVTCNHTGNEFRGQGVDEPFKTITAARDATGVVIPHVTKFRTGSIGHSIAEPLHTITAGGDSKRPAGAAHALGIVAAHVIGIDNKSSGTSCVWGANAPLTTITTENRHAYVSASLVPSIGEIEEQTPRASDIVQMSAPFLAKNYTGAIGSSVQAPIGTITSIDHHSFVSAHIQRQFGKSIGSGADTPVGTITAGGGGKTSIATSHLIKFRGTCQHGQPINEPMPTLTAGGLHNGEVRTLFSKVDLEKEQIKRNALREFARKYIGTDDLTITIDGDLYEIVDIGLRMLTPRELFRGQGFRESYIIDPEIDKVTKDGKIKRAKLSQSAQVRMCGNSVCPPVSEALVGANFRHEEAWGECKKTLASSPA